MEDNTHKIYGLIGYALLAYHHYQHKDKESQLEMYGYIALTFVYVPWYLNTVITKKPNTKKHLENEENIEDYLEKIGHGLIVAYYASKLMDNVKLHAILGLVGNLLFFTKFKKQAIMVLLVYYTMSIMNSHGSIGSMSLILYYYYKFEHEHEKS